MHINTFFLSGQKLDFFLLWAINFNLNFTNHQLIGCLTTHGLLPGSGHFVVWHPSTAIINETFVVIELMLTEDLSLFTNRIVQWYKVPGHLFFLSSHHTFLRGSLEVSYSASVQSVATAILKAQTTATWQKLKITWPERIFRIIIQRVCTIRSHSHLKGSNNSNMAEAENHVTCKSNNP